MTTPVELYPKTPDLRSRHQLAPGDADFEFFSASLLKASTAANGKKMLHGVASSTTKDLHGDTILRSALEDMERSALGMTIFLNHSYNVPDDVAGTVTKAIIKQQGVDDNGDPNYSLIFDIEIEEDNPQALRSWSFVQKGRKLGLSIGAMIPDGGAKRQKDGSYIIEHVLLLETSIVGIPANPKSWVDYAASALRGMLEKGTTANLGNPTLTLEHGRYRIEGSLDGLDLNLAAEVPIEPVTSYSFTQFADGKTLITRTIEEPDAAVDGMMTASFEQLGAWDLGDPDDKLVAIATVGEDVVQKATVWVETRDGDTITIGDPPPESDKSAAVGAAEVTAGEDGPETVVAACPSCGKGRGSTGCSDGYHKDVEPDVADAKVRIIEVDTDDQSSGDGSAQGASSEPDADDTYDSAPPADVSAATEPLILEGATENELLTASFDQLRAIALQTTRDLVETQRELAVEKAARIEAENQREATLNAAAELVRRTNEVIEKIGATPLNRKAKFVEGREMFASSVESFYGEEFAAALKGMATPQRS
jgi:phage head maturation protease